MIQTRIEGDLITHYSDAGKKLLQLETGIVYDEATDLIPCRYTYEETEEDIEQDEQQTELQEVLDILLGEDSII